jgi:hypothetical protein
MAEILADQICGKSCDKILRQKFCRKILSQAVKTWVATNFKIWNFVASRGIIVSVAVRVEIVKLLPDPTVKDAQLIDPAPVKTALVLLDPVEFKAIAPATDKETALSTETVPVELDEFGKVIELMVVSAVTVTVSPGRITTSSPATGSPKSHVPATFQLPEAWDV